jgi:hypothetical protein
MIEKALEEEVVFESLGILCHVTCRNIDIGQGFVDVLSCRDTIGIGPQGLCQALLDLLDGRVDAERICVIVSSSF